MLFLAHIWRTLIFFECKPRALQGSKFCVVKNVSSYVHTGVSDWVIKRSGLACACWEISKLIPCSWKRCRRRCLIWKEIIWINQIVLTQCEGALEHRRYHLAMKQSTLLLVFVTQQAPHSLWKYWGISVLGEWNIRVLDQTLSLFYFSDVLSWVPGDLNIWLFLQTNGSQNFWAVYQTTLRSYNQIFIVNL